MSSILKGIVNEVNPRDYDSDIDYYRALRRATQPKPERDVDDRPEYDIDMDRPVRKTRQPLIKIVDKEGISPETKNPYNTVMFLWGENNSDIELQIRKYEDIHWGAKNIVDIVDLPTKTDKVAKVVYIFDNHKYGYKQPTKQNEKETQNKTESAIMKGIQIEGANYNTAKNIALEIHQDVTDLGHIFAAGSKIGAGNPHNVEQLKQNIIDLNGELLNLGFEYDPRAKDFMKPMTVDVGARISENNGLPYPGTYEQETNMFKRKGAYRIGALTN